MKISIITPSYNQGQYLEETIQSVINQEYPDLEYIIIDGGSTDDSVDIIKKYEEDIDYWVSEKDNGQSDAINKGLKKATGDIVAWLNSDDLYCDNTLQNVAEIFTKNADVDLLYGRVINFCENENDVLWEVYPFNPVDFLKRTAIHQPGVFWRRHVHNEIGYLDESIHYQMDYDLWVRIFFNYNVMPVYETFSRFRIHKSSKTSNNPPELYLDYRRVYSRFINSLPSPDLKKTNTKLGIYENQDRASYKISKIPSEEDLGNINENYVYNYAEQEYTFGSFLKSLKLLFYLHKKGFNYKYIIKIMKIIFGVGYLRRHLK